MAQGKQGSRTPYEPQDPPSKSKGGAPRRRRNPKTQVPEDGTWGTLRVFCFEVKIAAEFINSKKPKTHPHKSRVGHPRKRINPKTQVPENGTWGTLRVFLFCGD